MRTVRVLQPVRELCIGSTIEAHAPIFLTRIGAHYDTLFEGAGGKELHVYRGRELFVIALDCPDLDICLDCTRPHHVTFPCLRLMSLKIAVPEFVKLFGHSCYEAFA